MARASQKFWDVPTRITHWALALCVVLNLFWFEGGDDPHTWLGYAAAAFVVFRSFWNFIGSKVTAGHNRLAFLAYLGMWGTVVALAVTGFMLDLDRYWGEEWLQNLHSNLSTALEVLIVAHLLGIAIDALRFRRNTFLGMLTGRKFQ